MNNTENETQPKKRTAQEVAELYAARKTYRASPEGQKASAEAARLLAIAKADDEFIMTLTDKQAEAWKQGDEENFDFLTKANERADKDRRNMIAAERAAAKSEAEKTQIAADAEAQRQRADRADADRHERHAQTFKPFKESILADKPDDFVYKVEIFLEAFDLKNCNRTTVTDALTSWARRSSKRPNHKPRQMWKLDREQAQLFYEDYIGDVRHQKRHALRTKAK